MFEDEYYLKNQMEVLKQGVNLFVEKYKTEYPKLDQKGVKQNEKTIFKYFARVLYDCCTFADHCQWQQVRAGDHRQCRRLYL